MHLYFLSQLFDSCALRNLLLLPYFIRSQFKKPGSGGPLQSIQPNYKLHPSLRKKQNSLQGTFCGQAGRQLGCGSSPGCCQNPELRSRYLHWGGGLRTFQRLCVVTHLLFWLGRDKNKTKQNNLGAAKRYMFQILHQKIVNKDSQDMMRHKLFPCPHTNILLINLHIW